MNAPWKVIAEIAGDNKKLHKLAVIKREAKNGNVDLLRGLRFGLDNLDSFGIKKVPVRSGKDGAGLSFEEFSKLANRLIKRELTGHAALAAVDAAMQTATNEQWNGWYRLILIKDFRAGFTESTVNDAVKDVNKAYVIPTTPYMRCSLPEGSNMEDWDWSEGVFSQIKADGMFANVNVREDGYVWITSRKGTLFPEGSLGIEDDISKTLKPGTQTHGEFTVYQDGKLLPRQIGNGILNSVLKGGSLAENQIVVLDAWDQIPLSAVQPKGKFATKYKDRYAALVAQVESSKTTCVKLIETRIVKTQADADAHFLDALARGLEGTVCKSSTATWKDGTSKDQVKMKLVVELDLEVVGFNPGKGKFAGQVGSVICRSSCGKLEVNVPGFDDDTRKTIDKSWIGDILTVCSNSLMEPSKAGTKYSVFLPRFLERRSDKTQADDLKKIKAQFAAAANAKKKLDN